MGDPVLSTKSASGSTTFTVPTYQLIVDNKKLEDQRGDVIAVRFCDAIKELSFTEIVLDNQDVKGGQKPKLKYSDGGLFELGQRLELKMGYQDGPVPAPMMIGEITAIEPSFSVREGMTVKIRALDRLHRLRNQPKSFAWKSKTDSKIVEEIATNHGLSHQTDDSGITHELIPQHNQDDLSFIIERAKRLDFELFMRDDKLHFIESKEGSDPELTLAWGHSLREFHPSATLAKQASSVRVRSWDPKAGKLIDKKVDGSALDPLKRAGNHAAKILEDALGKGKEEVITCEVALNDRDAERLARSVLRRNSHSFLTGWGETVGMPKLRAGISVELTGLGSKFSGIYYVTESTHCFDAGGYRTHFRVRRAFN